MMGTKDTHHKGKPYPDGLTAFPYTFSDDRGIFRHEIEFIAFSFGIYADQKVNIPESVQFDRVLCDLKKWMDVDKLWDINATIAEYAFSRKNIRKFLQFFELFHDTVASRLIDDDAELLRQALRRGIYADQETDGREWQLERITKRKLARIGHASAIISMPGRSEPVSDTLISICEAEEPVPAVPLLPIYAPGWQLEPVKLVPREEGIPYSPFASGIDTIAEYERVLTDLMDFAQQRLKVLTHAASTLRQARKSIDLPATAARADSIQSIPVKEDTTLIVVGDLHGCYNNFISVLEDTDFCARVRAKEDIYLILLGDYFDRGYKTIDGILPTLFNLIAQFPTRVVALSGNHDIFNYDATNKTIRCTCSPCDTIEFWKDHLSADFLERLCSIFAQAFPTACFTTNGIVFTHGGIPGARFVDRMEGIASLIGGVTEDEGLKKALWQMHWNDPGKAEIYTFDPDLLSRLPFGKSSFRIFMAKTGSSLLVRGHEEKAAGFEFTYPGELCTVFSAGGKDNPEATSYGSVKPKYLLIRGKSLDARPIPERW